MPSDPAPAAPTGRALLRDGFVTFLCRALSIVSALTMSIATARFLGPAGRGIFVLPTIDAGIAASFFAGLSTVVSYLLLNRRAGRGAVRASLLAGGVFVFGCTPLVFVLGRFAHHSWASLYAAASLPAVAIFLIAQGVCYGTKRITMANYLGVSTSVVALITTLAGLTFFGRTPHVAIEAWLISQTIVAFFGLALIFRYGRRLSPDRVSTLAALGFAGRMGGVSLVTLLNYRADIYMVAIFTSPSILGMYTLAVSGAEAALSATQAVATTTAPHIGSLSDDDSRRLTARAARNNVAIAAVACLSIGLSAQLLVQLAFGSRFLPVVGALRVMLCGIVALSTSAVFSNYFTLRRGRPELSLIVAGISAATSIALSYILIPRLGINGAAFAVTASYLLSATLLVAAFQRESKLPLRDILILTGADVRAYQQVLGRLGRALRRRFHLSPEAAS